MKGLLLLTLIAGLLSIIAKGEKTCACLSKNRRPAREIVSLSESDGQDTSDDGLTDGPKNEEEFRALLGRATWRLLHTMASRYPDKPTEEKKQMTLQFIDLLSHLYPCQHCSAHMRKMFAANPPQLDSQEDFSQWACKVHNIVNERLGKPQFPCQNVDSLYDCGCGLESPEHKTLSKPHIKRALI